MSTGAGTLEEHPRSSAVQDRTLTRTSPHHDVFDWERQRYGAMAIRSAFSALLTVARQLRGLARIPTGGVDLTAASIAPVVAAVSTLAGVPLCSLEGRRSHRMGWQG